MSALVSTKGFWDELKRPILALSPMDDITDAACRRLVARCGKPDVMLTEFVSVNGLCSPGRKRLIEDLRFDEIERPVVAQLFGTNPELFRRSAELVAELDFDGVDINMGCPVKVVCNTGAGSSLINEPELAIEIVQATIEGAGKLPVSIKTRIGYNKIQTEEWASHLLQANPAALTFHLRTRKEQSKVPAHWEEMPKIVKLAAGTGVLILGNGDIKSIAEAEKVVTETGCDGVMIGRAIFGNPWLFNREWSEKDISVDERLDTMLEHCRLYEEVFGDKKKFLVMRKHLMAYASGFPGAKDLRVLFERVFTAADVVAAVEKFRSRLDR
ncbi:MAG: tRNA-dihydrouridine synthase [candidate division Zixibacteria bacterium]|nr:tRNA-dihydrouridine synthase [candidate division Zixibacteria bacterium]